MVREIFLWLRKVAINAVVFGSLYAWKVLGIAGAGNVVQFYVWSISIPSLVLLFAPAKAESDVESAARNAASQFARLMLCFALAWLGETAMAVAYLIAAMSGAGYRSRCLALRGSGAKAPGTEGG